MGLRGPKPQSDEVKARKGNPGHNRIRPKQKPQPAALTKLPYAPSHLGKEATLEWKRTGKELIAAGSLTKVNLRLFESYCFSYGIFRDAKDRLETEGLTVNVGANDDEKAHPLIGIANSAQNMMLKMIKMIKTDAPPPAEGAKDPLADFFKRAEKLKVVKK